MLEEKKSPSPVGWDRRKELFENSMNFAAEMVASSTANQSPRKDQLSPTRLDLSFLQKAQKEPEALCKDDSNIPTEKGDSPKRLSSLTARNELFPTVSIRDKVISKRSKPFSEELPFLDELYASIKENNDVENILRRSTRDDEHKTHIMRIDRERSFQKSAAIKAHDEYPEHRVLTEIVPKIAETGGQILDQSKMKLGDKHIRSLAQGFKSINPEFNTINHINLRDNRISDEGIVSLLSAINKHWIYTIDLSESFVAKKGAAALREYIEESKSLEKLIIENCQINDSNLKIMLETCSTATNDGVSEDNVGSDNQTQQNSGIIKVLNGEMASNNFCSLVTLNLSTNKIGDRGVVALTEFLPRSSLRELDLSWNQIMNDGANALCAALIMSKTLVAIDLSWNSMGSKADQSRSAASYFSKMLPQNQSITHLDLSHNNFSLDDCKILAKGLSDNKTILGLHMDGNGGSVDPHGYLVPGLQPLSLEEAHESRRIISNSINISTLRSRKQTLERDNCWICGRWKEHRFTYQPSKVDVKKVTDILVAQKFYSTVLVIHVCVEIATSLDKWIPEPMNIRPPKSFIAAMEAHSKSPNKHKKQMQYDVPRDIIFGGKEYEKETDSTISSLPEHELFRVVPSGSHYYAFSINGGPLQYDPTLPSVSRRQVLLLIEEGQQIPLPMGPNGKSDPSLLPERVNVLLTESINDESTGIECDKSRKVVLPRSKNTEPLKRLKVWQISDSVVAKEMRLHDGNHLGACHMHDWYQLKYVKKIKSDPRQQMELESLIRSHFQTIQECYVDYSCKYSGDIFFMSNGAYSEFLTNCEILNSAAKRESILNKTSKGGIGRMTNKWSDGDTEKKTGSIDENTTGQKNDDFKSIARDLSKISLSRRMVSSQIELERQNEESGVGSLVTMKNLSTIKMSKRMSATSKNEEKGNENMSPQPPATSKPFISSTRQQHIVNAATGSGDNKNLFGNLKLYLYHCEDLLDTRIKRKKEALVNNIRVEFTLGGKEGTKKNSKIISNCVDPVYEEEFDFQWNGVDDLCVEVVDVNSDEHDKNISLGYTNIKFSSIDFSTGRLYELNNHRLDGVDTGKISLKVSFTKFNQGLNLLLKSQDARRKRSTLDTVNEGASLDSSSRRESKSDEQSRSSKRIRMPTNNGTTLSVARDKLVGNINKLKTVLSASKEIGTFRSQGFTRTDSDMIFIVMTQSGPRHEFNTKRTLARFQFTDALLEIANEKFVKTGLCKNIVVAFRKLLDQHIVPYAQHENCIKFRNTYLLVEVVDDVLRENLDIMAKIFRRYSGNENLSNETRTMSISEWMQLMANAQLEESYPWFTERAKQLAYCRSKAPSTNQFNDQNTFKKMTFYEFIEAVVRVVYILSSVEKNEEDGCKNPDEISSEDIAGLLPTIIRLMANTLTQKERSSTRVNV